MARLRTWLAQALWGGAGGAVRPVSRLAAGTLLAQLAPVLVAPILTRLYSPDAYGSLAWAISIVTVATLVASGTYEQAINLPAERITAGALVHGVIAAGILSAAVLALAALAEWSWRGHASHRMWFVPAATGLTVAFNALSAWAVREAQFGGLAAGRVTLALVGVGVTLALGFAGWDEAGLMTGSLAGLGAGIAMLLACLARDTLPPWPATGFQAMRRAATEYRRFPGLLLPSSLLNTVTNQLPVWFLQRLFGPAVVGHYALMNRVLSVPVSLIGSSAGEVFKQQAAAEFRTTGRSSDAWAAFARPLFWAAVPFGLALLAAGPSLFAWVFGERWREAGDYARVLAIFFVLRCTSSPLSYMLIVAQRQKLDLLLQGCCLGAALLGWLAGARSDSPLVALGVFGGIYSMVYLAYFVVSHRLAHGRMPALS